MTPRRWGVCPVGRTKLPDGGFTAYLCYRSSCDVCKFDYRREMLDYYISNGWRL